ncbi:hypothetical protein, partial [Bartonella heixiaziensis]|uniref:hypothetical protein n=1 Tax=Bartonella heixiaziensis TaxID=1461000 RepID=UPI003D2058D1
MAKGCPQTKGIALLITFPFIILILNKRSHPQGQLLLTHASFLNTTIAFIDTPPLTIDTGTQEHRNTGTQEHRNTGTQEHRNTGTQEHRNTGTQEHRNTGTQEHRNT